MSRDRIRMDLLDPYNIPSLEKARDDLKGRIAQLKLCYDLRDSQPPLNIWEGEAGMMEHIKINFPVPSMIAPSVVDQHGGSESFKSDTCSIASSSIHKNLLSAKQKHDQVGDRQRRIPPVEKPLEYFFDSTGRLTSAMPSPNKQSKNLNINDTSSFTPDCDVIVIDDEDENDDDCSVGATGNMEVVHGSEHSHQSVLPTASINSSNETAVKSHESSEDLMRINTVDNDQCSLSVNEKRMESPVNKDEGCLVSSRLLYDQSMPYTHYLKFNNGEHVDLTSKGPPGISRMEIKIDFDARHVSSSLDTKYVRTSKSASYVKEEDEITSKMSNDLNLNSVASEDQLASDLVVQHGAKAENMFPRKIEEWAASIEYIQSIFNELHFVQKSLSLDHQVLGGYPEWFYQSWRQVCFLMECIHADMEILRMSMNPENTQRKLILTVDLIKQIGNLAARKTSKKFQQMKALLRSMRNALRAHYNFNKNIFKEYNKKIKNVERMIKVPSLPLLSQHKRYLHYQQSKPLILPMTPGLAAGLYGKEERMLDRYANWLTQFNDSSKNTKLKTSREKRQPAEAIREPEQSCRDLIEDSELQTLRSLSTAHKNNSITITAQASDLSDPGNSEPLQTIDDRQDNANQEQNDMNSGTVGNNLETQQASESNTAAAELFNSKFVEWELREKCIRDLIQLNQTKIRNCSGNMKRHNLLSDKNFRTLTEICYLIEHLYYQVELEKLVVEPKNRTNHWLFSPFFISKLGQAASNSFSKRHKTILSCLRQSVSIIHKLYLCYKTKFRRFNLIVAHDDLKIRVPHLVHLSKSNRLAQIIGASKNFIMQESQGFEEAFFSKEKKMLQLPLMLIMLPIDLSLCQIIKFDEAFLKQRGQVRPKLCTEFQNLCQNWESLASEIESRFVEAVAVLSCVERISLTNINSIIESTCKTLICASYSLQSLFTQFVCLAFSLTDTACYFTKNWRLSETVSKIVGEKSKDKEMCEKLKKLFSALKGLEKKCYQIFQRNINVIMTYNEQVEGKCKVQLPRLISDLSAQIKVLISHGSILEASSQSIASFQEKTVNVMDSLHSPTTPSSTCHENNQGQNSEEIELSPIWNRKVYFPPSLPGNSYTKSKLNEKDLPLTFLVKEKAHVGVENQESPMPPTVSGLNTKNVQDIPNVSTGNDEVQVSAEIQENIEPVTGSGTSSPNTNIVQDIPNFTSSSGKDEVQVSAETQENVEYITGSGTSSQNTKIVHDIPNFTSSTGNDEVQVSAETQQNIDSVKFSGAYSRSPNTKNVQDIQSNAEVQLREDILENRQSFSIFASSNLGKKQTQSIQSCVLLPGSELSLGFNFKLNNYQDLMINSLINLEGTDHNTCLSEQYLPESVRDANLCKCGCYGVPLLSNLNCRAAVDKPLWLRLYLLHIDIQNLKDCLIEAEAGMVSCKIPQPTHCKLIVDVSATILYLQTVLNKESYDAYRYGCEDLSVMSEEKLNMVGLCQHDIVTVDFQAVEMLLEFLNEDLNRIMIEKQEFILLFFPHAEESRRKRNESSQCLPLYRNKLQAQPKTRGTKKKKKTSKNKEKI